MSSHPDAPAASGAPPGPAEPPHEQVRQWIETPVEFWAECGRRYGPVVALDLGSLGPVVLLSEPDAVRQVFQFTPDRFEVRHFNEHYRYVMGDHALLLQDGEEHQRQRRLLSPPLRPDQLLPRAGAIAETARRAVAGWPSGALFNPRPALNDAAFQVVLHVMMGDADSETSRALLEAYRGAVVRQVGSWGPWRNFTRLQPRMRGLLHDDMQARRADPERPGAMTRVALSQHADGTPVTDAQYADQLFSMMIAGVDTVAIALAWALYWLARAPAVRDRLAAELAAAGAGALGVGDPASDGRALLALPYLNAVYSETVRMYPVVPTPSGRRLLRETRVGGYTFAAGTTLVPCTYLVHRRAELFPDGDRFVPERFLDRKFAPYEYFPYGGGVRRCIGEALAHLEFKVVLATILAQWHVEASDDPTPVRAVRHGTLLAPEDRFRLRVRPVAPAPSAAPAAAGEGALWS